MLLSQKRTYYIVIEIDFDGLSDPYRLSDKWDWVIVDSRRDTGQTISHIYTIVMLIFGYIKNPHLAMTNIAEGDG